MNFVQRVGGVTYAGNVEGPGCFERYFRLIRIPSPSFASDRNSMPAFSKARRMEFAVLVRASTAPCS
jgi:hypothetical protein